MGRCEPLVVVWASATGGACKNTRMNADAPLSEAEFATLDAFLSDEEAPSDCMDTSMLDGYLAAVVSGPSLIMPNEMLRWIWDTEGGQESPEFKSNKEAQTIIGLIMRHHQHVNATFSNAPHDYRPRILQREHEGRLIPIIDEWCSGYYLGMALDLQAWTPLMLSQPKLFAPILTYGTDDGFQTLANKPFDADLHQANADSLVDTACQIHAFWLAQRRQQMARGETPGIKRQSEPFRNAGKVGRNEPCPCGSGKKFKHCHGGIQEGGQSAANDPTLH